MILQFVLLVAGFLALVKGADILVAGAVNISRRSGLSEMLVGLTIVALGTSLPELAVSISAALKGSGIALGNVLGSNVANTALVLGTGAILLPVSISKRSRIYEIPFVVLSTLAASMLILGRGDSLTRFDGIVLLCFFAVFMAYAAQMASSDYNEGKRKDSTDASFPLPKSIVLILVGFAGVVAGSELVVRSGSSIALFFGVSETLVGMTIVAIGTSLPEMVTTIVAVVKGSGGLALGNLLGSNLMNLLMVLGVASLISPIVADRSVLVEILFMFGSIVVLMLMCVKSKQLGRSSGLLLISIYIAFLFSTVLLG